MVLGKFGKSYYLWDSVFVGIEWRNADSITYHAVDGGTIRKQQMVCVCRRITWKLPTDPHVVSCTQTTAAEEEDRQREDTDPDTLPRLRNWTCSHCHWTVPYVLVMFVAWYERTIPCQSSSAKSKITVV